MRAALFALLPVLAVSATVLQARQGAVPQCALGCFAAWSGECGQDPACICTNDSVKWNILGCLPQQCSGADAAAAQAFGENFCASAAGVSMPAGDASPTVSIAADPSASQSSDDDGVSVTDSGPIVDATTTSAPTSVTPTATISEAASAVASASASLSQVVASASASVSGVKASASSALASVSGSIKASVSASASASASSSAAASARPSGGSQRNTAAGIMGVLGAAAGAIVLV